jgi:heat shock protein HtpX
VISSPESPAENWLVSPVERQAGKAGVGMPEVAVFDSPSPNAFATGMRRDRSLVAVSTGLLRAMSREEVEAVLGHEISHVANGDMVTLALIQGVVNTFVIFLSRVAGHLVDRVVFRTQRGHGPGFLLPRCSPSWSWESWPRSLSCGSAGAGSSGRMREAPPWKDGRR